MATQIENPMGQLGNMDQIRELMFGPQIRKFEEDLNKLQEKMNIATKELTQKIIVLEKKLTAENTSNTQLLEQKIKTVSNALQDESIELKEQLVRQERKANNALDDVQKVFESQIDAMKRENIQNKEELHNELEELEASIMKLLKQQVENLEGAKVSKDNLSSMLFDLAIKVKDTTIAENFDMMIEESAPKEEAKSK
ncbi:hypothetical protein LCX93_04530 [Sulfurimonas sp. SWIR-19]|uniref:hypothetical protein n=1 Tax=Sulfurimonas sp. SWIR-19 TaxID=2878390 RepID=UPI001CF45D94|nr:hypothetical protein [Sulfurimonas sp. SWIR-19]UCN01185.1 hypothetical protein LCX93_04530 [Sulfurimonas sp. SWIR-19]